MTGAKVAPNRPDMTGKTARGRNVRSRDAAHNRTTSSTLRRGHAAFTIHPTDGRPFEIAVTGQVCWALVQLVASWEISCTPVLHPAPKWSGYVFDLRQLGVEIEKPTEKHGHNHPERHRRFVLRGRMTREGGDA
jgi:hypothetical protein